MKSLLLHNNNLPGKLISAFESKIPFYPSRTEQFDAHYDLDRFIDARLKDILSKNNFDCIFISLSLNNDDYLQLTGLLVALHIRLTPKLNHQRVPIVLVGPESHFEISKLSSLDDVIYTPAVFLLNDQSPKGKSRMESFIQEKNMALSDEQLKIFLDRIVISPPFKYSSHHSLANEWGVMRMSEVFSDALTDALQNDLYNIKQNLGTSLYFKFLEEKFKRKRVKAGDRIPATLPGVTGKKVVYIDDEYGKGWGNLLKFLCEKSDAASFEKFEGFKKGLDRDALLIKIKAYLDGSGPEVNDADIYIVDLRLCDQDFDNNSGVPTGLQVLDHLLSKNMGNQVVIFTASNKIWNMKDASKRRACAYTIKESPELRYSFAQTKMLFSDFQGSIRLASEKSYLRGFWAVMEKIKSSQKIQGMNTKGFSQRLIGEGGWLNQIFTLLMMHDKANYNQIVVIFLSILELYSEIFLRFDVLTRKGYVTAETGHEIYVFHDASKGFYSFERNGFVYQINRGDEISGVHLYQQMTDTPSVRHAEGNRMKLLTKVVPVLQTRHGFNKKEIDTVIELKYLRDNLAAHGNNNVNPAQRRIMKEDIDFILEALRKIFT
jgi:hypothetical protein